ncbi:hypothetical protein KAW80_00065 [Candidatus Babeliales bacterium]|nr:hypothetical protein [Candidatus Babeliales bacterium]
MLARLKKTMFGDIAPVEVKKYLLLALTFFFTIGAYWLLRPLKDGIFFNTVGKDLQPNAKWFSLVIVLFLVFVYNKMIDLFEKHKLFYILGIFYSALFFLITYFLAHPTIGLANKAIGSHRWIGWLVYFSIESFGSLMIALFWSFVASITDANSAKRGFPIVIAGGQVGGILGPTLAMNAKLIGVTKLFFLASIYPLLMVLMIMLFMYIIPKEALMGSEADQEAAKKPKTSFMEGLKLLVTRSYLFGIFAIVSLFEILSTIVDYQLKVQAKALPEYSDAESLTRFLGIFGISTNGVALIMALLGTSYLMRRFGLIFCLLAFPTVLGFSISGLYFRSITPGITPHALLWTTFFVMILAKGLSYALNNPAKDMMYIPTSKDAKFKTKSWIDAFGSRSAKAVGSGVNKGLLPILQSSGIASFIGIGAISSLGMIAVWLFAALFVGRKFVYLTKENKIIE